MMIKNRFDYFLEPNFNFGKIWERFSSCNDRGINVFEENSRTFAFYSYREIYTKAASIACAFMKKGIVPGERILLSAKTNICFPVMWIACVLAGVIPVPLPPSEAFLTHDAFRTRIREIIPFFKRYFCYENETDDIEGVSSEMKTHLELIPIPGIYGLSEAAEPQQTEPRNPLPSDVAFIQFTSGSTTFPKGIMVTYKNLLANLHGLATRWEVIPEKCVFGSWLPLYHDMGLIGLLLESMFTQSSLVLVPAWLFAKNPLSFMDILSSFKVEICCMTNFALELIMKRLDPETVYTMNLDSLRFLGIGAEPVSVGTLEKFEEKFSPYGLRENVLSPGYGLAESTLAVSVPDVFYGYRKSMHGHRVFPTVGRPLENTEVKIVDESDNREKRGIVYTRSDSEATHAPIHGEKRRITDDEGFCNTKDIESDNRDKKGVIYIRSDSVATHALIHGERRRITDDEGFYNTKDIGYFCDDQLVIMGRADTMFIVNGENFFPHEIESIVSHSGLIKHKRVACFAIRKDESPGTEVVVAYESKPLTKDEKKRLDDEIRKIVAKNLSIRLDTILSLRTKSIPLTTSGKTKHKELAKLYSSGLLEQNIVASGTEALAEQQNVYT